MTELLSSTSRYLLVGIALIILTVCCVSLLKIKAPKIKPAVFVDNRTSEEYPVTHWETSIGRSNSCDITLKSGTISKFHAVLSKQKAGWVITDTLSKNGIIINEKRIEKPTVISSGDKIMLGDTILIFRER